MPPPEQLVRGLADNFWMTGFRSYAAREKDEGPTNLQRLVSAVLTRTAPEKGKLPWLKLARFGDQPTDKGSLRHDGNVVAITGVEADHDTGDMTVDEAVALLTKAGVLAMVYTSPSHTEDHQRWRVLCPTSTELPPGKREHLVGRLNGLLRGVLAGESFTLSQSYYYGSVNSNPSHRVELIDGAPIDTLDELDVTWRGKPNTTSTHHSAGGEPRSGPIDEAAILEALLSGDSYHAAMTSLLGKWAFAGVPLMEARQRVIDAMQSVAEEKRDARWQVRFADIDRCVGDIYGKEAKRKDKGERKPKARRQEQPRAGEGPLIRVVAGHLHTTATEAEAAIKDAGVAIFQRGNALVRPVVEDVPAARGRTTVSAGLTEISVAGLIDTLCGCATWEKFDARAGDFVRINPPKQVAETILARVGLWKLPKIVGVVTTPTIRPDGSILSAPGYDPATRLYHAADPGLALSGALHRPTREAAAVALALLDGLLTEFPFVSAVSRAVALSALITPVVRGALAVAPLHAFRASTAGTGKSFLVDVASTIASGRPCPVAAAGAEEVETEKRLAGLLLAGFPIASLDNCNGELGGDLLCQAIERPFIRLRPLGRSEIIEVESRATLFATGNALRVRGDMVRRVVISDLDAGMERPELREFRSDPVATIMADRGRYVSAALTVVRAYIVAGYPGLLPPIASFADWSGLVRSALVWLGCADPAASMEQAREDDPELADLREVLTLWRERIGDDGITVRDLAERASERKATMMGEPTDFSEPELRDALLRIAGERGNISTLRLGRWLLAREGRIANGWRFQQAGMTHGGVKRWKVSRA